MNYEKLIEMLGDEVIASALSEQGENVIIEKSVDGCVKVITCQKNGWLRTNIYHKDGTTEELYDR